MSGDHEAIWCFAGVQRREAGERGIASWAKLRNSSFIRKASSSLGTGHAREMGRAGICIWNDHLVEHPCVRWKVLM